MKKSDFILEIGTEEIPSGYITPALNQLKNLFAKHLNDTRIDYLDIETYGTCRRLVVYVKEVAGEQRERDIEIVGPPKNRTFDESGNLTQIGVGFAKSHGVDVKLLKIKETPKGEYVYISKREKANKTSVILSAIIPNIITSVEFPKSMRWHDNTRFARPIRWILALYGKDTIKFSVSDVLSDNFIYCHRFLSSGKKEVLEAKDYFKIVRKGFCIVSQSERKNIIKEKAEKLAESKGGKLYPDDKLLEELTYIVEYPEVILCEFDKDFLKLSPDILVQVMKQQQKYIPIVQKGDCPTHSRAPEGSGYHAGTVPLNLLNNFILVTNGVKNKSVKENNEKVLKARFKDAEFFYNEDTKTSLASKTWKLSKVVWQEHLGTLLDKTDRLSKLSKILADELKLDYETGKILKRASELSKIDLNTELVREFPELQGLVGRIYALKDGEKREVAYAIEEQYLPRYFGDDYVLPKTKAGIILSIAEKIDNLTGCFLAGITPTGSADPYGLKRQAIGLINIVLKEKLDFPLKDLFRRSVLLFSHKSDNNNNVSSASGKLFSNIEAAKADPGLIVMTVVGFIKQRFENMLLEKEIKYDVIRAILNSNFDSILEAEIRVNTLASLRNTDKFNEIVTAFSRVINILPKKEYKKLAADVRIDLFTEEEEKKLYDLFLEVKAKAEESFLRRDFEAGFNEMSKLKTDIDGFFNKVMVMVNDENIKNNRLAILKNINELFLKFADFSQLVF